MLYPPCICVTLSFVWPAFQQTSLVMHWYNTVYVSYRIQYSIQYLDITDTDIYNDMYTQGEAVSIRANRAIVGLLTRSKVLAIPYLLCLNMYWTTSSILRLAYFATWQRESIQVRQLSSEATLCRTGQPRTVSSPYSVLWTLVL